MSHRSQAKNADSVINAVQAAMAGKAIAADERRARDRVPYNGRVAIVLVTREGERWGPLVARATNISVTGLAVRSRNMIHPGLQGVIQLRRSDGRMAIVGVEVVHSRYAGNMQHETGLQFIRELPLQLAPEDFVNRAGRMKVLNSDLLSEAEEIDPGP